MSEEYYQKELERKEAIICDLEGQIAEIINY